MNATQWQRRITHAVKCAADGNPKPLEALAQRLADIDTATDALIAAGYGSDDDDIPELVSVVLEKAHGEAT